MAPKKQNNNIDPRVKHIIKSTQNYKVNVIWIIAILFVLLIGMIILYIFTRVNNPEHLINFISGMGLLLSIILSIFAIQFTYSANNEMGRQFDHINQAAADIKETSQRLIETEGTIKGYIETIRHDIETIKQTSVTKQQMEELFKNSTSYEDVDVKPGSQHKL